MEAQGASLYSVDSRTFTKIRFILVSISKIETIFRLKKWRAPLKSYKLTCNVLIHQSSGSSGTLSDKISMRLFSSASYDVDKDFSCSYPR